MTEYIEPKLESFNDKLNRLFPYTFSTSDSILTLTFQVTEDCCMNCSYCYQNKKSKNKMDFETSKKIIDNLILSDSFYNTYNTKAIVLEFIGGEPFLEVELMDKITGYFIQKCIENKHRFLYFFRISIASNGLLYFEEKVQNFIKKYHNFLALTISIDGNKELHDSCRLDLNGEGTYDRVVQAVNHYSKNYSQDLETKMTLSPNNIQYVFNAIQNLINLGYISISLNCIYEQGWENIHAKILYNEMKKIADWLIENDAFKKYRISLFDINNFVPLENNDTKNWCGGTCGSMLAFDYKGIAFPCIRYMESSLNNKQIPYSIGNIEGLFQTHSEKERLKLMKSITRQSQSTKECLECPIAKGCAWCSAYNYECYGTPNKRATFICEMHKARSLANAYYYNKGNKLLGKKERIKIFLPKNEALNIISEEEWNILKYYENNV